MVDAFTLLYLSVPLVGGILAGYIVRNRKQIRLEKASILIVVVLIFCLGFSIGSNNALLVAMPTVGLQALLICLLAVSFSIILVIAGKRLMGK